MIIDVASIYKKIIHVLVKKNHKIRLRKAEKETIQYDGSSVEDGYNKIIELLIKTKRIKKNTLFDRIWGGLANLWKN